MERAHRIWSLRITFLVVVILALSAPGSQAAKKCYDCHSKAKAEFTSKKNIHAPVKEENCESCHKRHGFSNQLVLTDNTSQLCFTCHADLKDKYAVGNVHLPLSKANCWECHDPHSSDKKALLRKGPEDADDPNSCFPCHKQLLPAKGASKYQHAPYESLDCVACHDPHNSPQPGLLKAEATTLCATCHKADDKKMAAAHSNKPIQGLGCEQCHSGHSSNTKGLLSQSTHVPFAEGNCDGCHNLPDPSGKITFPEGVTAGNVCANCHSDQVDATKLAVAHPAVEPDNCDNCHTAHSSKFGALLKQEEKSTCLECHSDIIADTTLETHMPASVGDCGSCHEVHGSKNEHLLKKTDASMCLGCHTNFAAAKDSAKSVHAATDDCLQCHNPHQGKTKALLKVDPADLCKTCHEVDPKALLATSGHVPYMRGECISCHDPHYSGNEHLVRAPGPQLCVQCHADEALRLKMATVHPPAADLCTTCHSPHFANSPSLLSSSEKELCTSCHSPEDLGTSKEFVHTPAATGDCTGCHNPHGSIQPKLLTGRMKDVVVKGVSVKEAPVLNDKRSSLCYTCHETLQEKFESGTAHKPVAEGKCEVCHATHGADHRGFIKDTPAALCGTCHTVDAALQAKHNNYDLSKANCADCHNPHISKQPKLLRENEHPPFAEKECESCHTAGPDGKVQMVGDMNEVCGACHDIVGTDMGKKDVHAPFAGGQCTDCHSAHASDFKKMLRDDSNNLCLSCHTDVRALQKETVQHRPFMQGKCLDCHKPHSSEYASLTTKPPETFCVSCHTDLKEQMSKGTAHSPARAGNCLACHKPHAGPTAALLVKSKQELCSGCHDLTSAALTTAHHGFDMTKVDCQNCHAAHVVAKGTKALLLPNTHKPFASRNCDQCHQPTGARELIKPGQQLCLSCHTTFQKEQMSKAVVHGPLLGDNGCVACHGPHVGFGNSLQKKQGPAACLKCHNGPEFTGSVKHQPAFEDCANCHQPHSAEYKGLLDTPDINELCERCHEDAPKKHYHPMGKDVIDPRTKQTLNCLGCHSAHSSNYKAQLVADLNRQLCINCHDVNHN